MSGERKTSRAGLWITLGFVILFAGLLATRITREPWTLKSGFTGAWLLVELGAGLLILTLLADWGAFREFFARYWLTAALGVALAIGLFLPESLVTSLRPTARVPAWMMRMLFVLALQGGAAWLFVATRKKESHVAERAALAAMVAFVLQVGLALLLMLNILSANHLTRWLGIHDATETGLYTLSDRTRGLLDSLSDLPAPVHAVYVDFGTAQQAYPGEQPIGNRAKDYLQQYGDYTPRFTVKQFNGIREKTSAEAWLRELGITDPNLPFEDTVVFLYRPVAGAEPNRKDVPVRPATFMDRSPLGTSRFKAEQQFTSAIQDVTLPKKKVYFLTGHEERPLYGTEADSLVLSSELVRKLSVDVEKLSLGSRRTVPADADLIIVVGPRLPLTAAEQNAIVDYLEAGGALILLVDPQMGLLSPGVTMVKTGLEPFFAKMGIQVRSDFRSIDYDVLTGRGNRIEGMRPTPVVTTTEYGFHPIVEDLRDGRFAGVFPEVSPVMKEMPEDAEGLDVEELIFMRRAAPEAPGQTTFAQKLFPNRTDDRPMPGVDLTDKRISLAIAARREVPGSSDRSTRVVVFGDSDFVTQLGMDPQAEYFGTGNPSIFSNAVAWAIRTEQLISIEPKTLELERTELTERQRRMAQQVSLFGIPGLILFLSILVAWRRRR